MTCADNCSSYSHDRAAVVAAALAGCSVGVAVAKGVTSPPLDHPPNPPTLLAPLIKFKCIYLTTTAHTVVPLMKLWSTALCTPPSFTPRHRRLPTLRCNDLARHRLSIEKITPVYVVRCVVARRLLFRCFNNHHRHPTHGIPWRSFD